MFKKVFMTVLLFFYVIIFSQHCSATEKLGIYGFYLGQSVQEVLDNAAEKKFNLNYGFQAGEEKILKDLKNLPNGQNITDNPGSTLSVLPKVLEEIIGKQEYSELRENFNNSLKILGKSGQNNVKHYFFELSAYRDEKIPPIYLGFVINKEKDNMQLYQIKLSIHPRDYEESTKEFLNKLNSTINSRYGEPSSTSNDRVKFINIDNSLIIKTRFYNDGFDNEIGFYFYDWGLILNIINNYIDLATQIDKESSKKAFDDM